MLMRLGRWLRAAGYDTIIAVGGQPDAALIRQARLEARLLVTRDRKMLEHRHAAEQVMLLSANTTDECAVELARRAGIDWLHAPFTRCLLCNRPLQAGDAADRARIPEHSRMFARDIRRCAHCDKIYWPGGHVRRMRRRLETWRNMADGHATRCGHA